MPGLYLKTIVAIMLGTLGSIFVLVALLSAIVFLQSFIGSHASFNPKLIPFGLVALLGSTAGGALMLYSRKLYTGLLWQKKIE